MTYDQFLMAFLALNVLDVLTTIAILKRGGVELNPVLRRIMDAIGVVPALLVFKVLIMAAFMQYEPPIEVRLFVLCSYVAVVGNNLRVLRKM